ncbi:hypothetical protein ACFQOY_09265 [Enterococcus alcedinis]|uniref:hypothetical protein n=1 Tax=Enterococcus alcedinis TaxID=1274384 RepID=UPI0036241237
MLVLAGCAGKNPEVKASNETQNEVQVKKEDKEDDLINKQSEDQLREQSENKEEEYGSDEGDWYGGGDLDDKVDDSHLSKEEQTKNQELGKLKDGQYGIELVYPYEDRIRFNVLYEVIDNKLDSDKQAALSDAYKMPEDDSAAVTVKLDSKINGKESTYRHGLFLIEVKDGVITSVKQSS